MNHCQVANFKSAEMKKNGISKRETEQLFGEASNLQRFINKYGKSFKTLTAREVEVLTLIAGELNNAAIAGELGIDRKTVQNYRSSMRRKLAIKNETDYIKFALAFGLISF